MGAQSSSLSELASNPHLQQLASTECLTPNDPFWNQLLSFTFHIPRTSADQRLLEESTLSICKNFAINNCQTGNFGSLVRVFLTRATELKAAGQCEDNIFTWQTYNALFIMRNICKYFVENLSDEMLAQQFEMTSPNAEGKSKEEDIIDELLCCIIEILVDFPVVPICYALHLECVNMLLVLMSIQMFQPSPACQSTFYKHMMQGKCAIHACVLMKTLILNFVKQEMAPRELVTSTGESGVLYKASAAVASGLFSMVTLGIGPRLMSQGETEPDLHQPLLATQSLLLTLVLANHCTSDSGLHNPYRQAVLAFTNSQDDSEKSTSQAIATFKTDYTELYNVLCSTLKEDQTTLLLYLLMHRNLSIKAFVMSRTNIDQLVVPLLKILYHAQEKNSHHIYMALIILLILSEDESFNRAVHEINLKNVAWFKERSVGEISLGGLLILVVIRTIQYNMTRMRDKYLHTNCLAALANMSAQFRDLHPYVAQRIVSLFGQLQKKHTRLVEQIKETSETQKPSDHSESETESEANQIADLQVLEEVIRMVLEIVNSTLTYSLQHNANLIYAMLYHKELFNHFSNHPTFQDIIQNLDTVLSFFSARLEQCDKNISVPEVLEAVKQGALQFRKDRLKKFPELKFKYVEEEAPEEFFIPYVWSLVFHASQLYFNSSRIRLFSLHSSPS